MIVDDVLNNKIVLEHFYRNRNIFHLVAKLGQCENNLLIIGHTNSWIINSKTSKKHCFVGTRIAQGLTSKASREKSWTAIQELALRYAARGSTIYVFCLHPKNGDPALVSVFKKDEEAPYQPPGCAKSA